MVRFYNRAGRLHSYRRAYNELVGPGRAHLHCLQAPGGSSAGSAHLRPRGAALLPDGHGEYGKGGRHDQHGIGPFKRLQHPVPLLEHHDAGPEDRRSR